MLEIRPTNQVPENVKKAAREIVDVLIQNHLRRWEAANVLESVADAVRQQNCEVKASELQLPFSDD